VIRPLILLLDHFGSFHLLLFNLNLLTVVLVVYALHYGFGFRDNTLFLFGF